MPKRTYGADRHHSATSRDNPWPRYDHNVTSRDNPLAPARADEIPDPRRDLGIAYGGNLTFSEIRREMERLGFRYGTGDDETDSSTSSPGLESIPDIVPDLRPVDASSKPTRCTIYLENTAWDSVEIEVCKHVFHDECIRRWLSRFSTCPNCRQKP